MRSVEDRGRGEEMTSVAAAQHQADMFDKTSRLREDKQADGNYNSYKL